MRATHPGFTLCFAADGLDGQPFVAEYVHGRTGARHFHLNPHSRDLACLIGVRTPACDDRGVAHVLEHLVLCGSEAFGGGDLYFRLANASLRTHMSAFTRIDWTGFLFSSRSTTDYRGLFDVYADAVFRPCLDEAAFSGDRRRGRPTVGCHALVFNEMRGIQHSPLARSWYAVARHLYAGTPYQFNNCGVPEHIGACTLTDVKAFHRAHYTGERPVFVTHGQIPLAHQHAAIDEALAGHPSHALVPKLLELPHVRATRAREEYPASVAAPRTDLLVGWRLSRCCNLEQALELRLLAEILFAGRASPLVRALEDVDIGSRVAPLCGLEDGYPDPALVCGLVDCDDGDGARLDDLLDGVLHRLARQGVARAHVDGAFKRVSLAVRRPRAGEHPYWLGPMSAPARASLRGLEARSFFQLGKALAELQQRVADPAYVRALIERHLCDNPNRVRLTLVATPRPTRAPSRSPWENAPPARAAGHAQCLGPARPRAQRPVPIAPLAEAHRTVLPRAALRERMPNAVWTCGAASQGVVHEHVAVLLNGLPDPLLDLVPAYVKTALHAAQRRAGHARRRALPHGTREGRVDVRASISDVNRLQIAWMLEADCLPGDFPASTAFLRGVVASPPEVTAQALLHSLRHALALQRHGLVQAGHRHLLWAAGAGLAPGAYLAHRWEGLEGILVAHRLLRDLKSRRARTDILDAIAEIAGRLRSATRRHLLVASADDLPAIMRAWQHAWRRAPAGSPESSEPMRPARTPTRAAWLSAMQQTGCAVAYSTVPAGHPDSAALTVLAHCVQDAEVLSAVRREGGAYACGAGHDAANGVFHLFSFRDPDVLRSLDLFAGGFERRIERAYEAELVKRAKRAALRALEPAASPIDDAKIEFVNHLHGRTVAHRQAYRDRLFAIQPADVARAATRYLRAVPSAVVLADPADRRTLERHGFTELHAIDAER